MSKKNNKSAPVEPAVNAVPDAVGEDAAALEAVASPGEQAGGEAVDAGAPVDVDESKPEEAATVELDTVAPPPDDNLDIPSGVTVPALVLSDNHLGRVGQVVQVNAAHAEALRLGGLIDTHPNAIESATPED